MAHKTAKLYHFKDECVIYYSRTDKLWVAHGLHTNWVGLGNSVLDSLVNLLEGYESLFSFVKKHENAEIYNKAPIRIRLRAKRAIPLPKKLYERAHKKAHGQKYVSMKSVPFKKNQVIKANIEDYVCLD